MVMPFWAIILFSVRLADISFSFERCISFSIFASVTGSKESPIGGSFDRVLQIHVCVTNFKSGKCTLICEITAPVQTGLTVLTVSPPPLFRLMSGLPLAVDFFVKNEGPTWE